jgi:hypothetical protein
MVIVSMSMPESSGSTVVKLQDKDGLSIFSINNNGTVTLGLWDTGDSSYKDFDLNAPFLALMTGQETRAANCGNNDSNMQALRYRSDANYSWTANCISRQDYHGVMAMT